MLGSKVLNLGLYLRANKVDTYGIYYHLSRGYGMGKSRLDGWDLLLSNLMYITPNPSVTNPFRTPLKPEHG